MGRSMPVCDRHRPRASDKREGRGAEAASRRTRQASMEVPGEERGLSAPSVPEMITTGKEAWGNGRKRGLRQENKVG